LYYRDHRARAHEDATKNLHYNEISGEKKRKTVFYQVSKNGKKVLWSRGNGWVVGGLPRILTYLPKDHALYPKYEELFKAMAYSLKDRQGDDGYWRPNLDDADDYPMPETSGTGFFTYGVAWGINSGILPNEEFLPVAKKGWKALYNAVSDEGKVQWGQLVAGGPYEVRKEDSHEYVTGAFLLAGSEMLKLTAPDTEHTSGRR
jgi:rhamnogalacturonyl hydrolase YesR